MTVLQPAPFRARLALLSTGIVLILGMAWLGSHSDEPGKAYSLRGAQNDYYSLLVHGLQKGHLYMDVAVDPRRSSADPAIQRKSTTLLDASLYKNRYYLYFGIVPAVFLLLPYHLLTGSDLSENTAVLIMLVAGTLVYWRLLAEASKRYFPAITTGQYAASMALLAAGSGAPMLLTYAEFYEVAISAGFLCHALAWFALYKALHSEGKEARWLALASLAGGLAVGCRPNYLVVLPVIALAAVFLVRRGGSPRKLSLCAVLPAAGVGLALAAYNYARFGSPLEFGLGYQLDEMVLGKFPMFRLSFLWSNVKWYLLRPSAFSPYFPYVFPMNAAQRPEGYYGYETIHGQLPVTLLALLSLAWLFVRRRRAPLEPSIKAFMGLMGLAFALLFLGLASYGNRAERYTTDFQASLVLLIVITAGLSSSQERKEARPRGWRLAFIGAALCASLSNVLAGLQLDDHFVALHPSAWRTLSRWGDRPSGLMGRMGLMHFGPVRFKFLLPPLNGPVSVTPLLATGLPQKTDVLYLTQLPGNVIQLKVTHTGFGEVKSGLITVDPHAEHELEVDFGSLYPPRDNPWFQGMGDDGVELLKTTALVQLDQHVVISRRVAFFDSPPGWVSFGRNPGGTDPPFDGKVTATEFLPPREAADLLAMSGETGVVRLAVTFPFEYPNADDPVIASGTVRHGNMLLLHTLADHSVQFDLDQWGQGIVRSPRIPVAADGSHELEIFVGGQVARARLPSEWNLDAAQVANAEPYLRLWLDGQPVWTIRVAINRDTYNSISVGSNPQRFSSSPAYYFGAIESQPLSPDETRGLIVKNIVEGSGIRGLHHYGVEIPPGAPAAGLPLLGVGVAGNGNLLYARAVRPGIYRVGMDDWGLTSREGPEFPLSAGTHDVQIVLGPVVAGAGLPGARPSDNDLSALRGRFLVFIDNAPRGNFEVTHHLDKLDIVTPGANPQGFSTAAPEFPGLKFVPEPMTDAQARTLISKAIEYAR